MLVGLVAMKTCLAVYNIYIQLIDIYKVKVVSDFRNIDFGDLLAPEHRVLHRNTTYDLMANVVHDGEPERGKGTYRVHVLHKVCCSPIDIVYVLLWLSHWLTLYHIMTTTDWYCMHRVMILCILKLLKTFWMLYLYTKSNLNLFMKEEHRLRPNK